MAAQPALGQQPKVNCKKAETQMEMTYCAEQDYNAADKALNIQYQAARKATKKWDTDAATDLPASDAALVKAQRAWVAYRDAHCESYGYQAHGGTMEPQLIYACSADLTRKRTAELKELTDAFGN
ncbi:lysozyme inhibitor LprI family protein [Rhizobium terrae]|uniref:lysozyme inhibitor LprI family protein n=1 Tax=Rhizobium terrae TaxID=2171756 RepID=UPI001D025A26|nr:lysozyme inhibitor LprI family protein [Rhizobium terrae]